MNGLDFEADAPVVSQEELYRLTRYVRGQLCGRVQQFHLAVRNGGLVLSGIARNYYAKQLAQHAVMAATRLPIRANEIEVL
jgi:hypothetical protein